MSSNPHTERRASGNQVIRCTRRSNGIPLSASATYERLPDARSPPPCGSCPAAGDASCPLPWSAKRRSPGPPPGVAGVAALRHPCRILGLRPKPRATASRASSQRPVAPGRVRYAFPPRCRYAAPTCSPSHKITQPTGPPRSCVHCTPWSRSALRAAAFPFTRRVHLRSAEKAPP